MTVSGSNGSTGSARPRKLPSPPSSQSRSAEDSRSEATKRPDVYPSTAARSQQKSPEAAAAATAAALSRLEISAAPSSPPRSAVAGKPLLDKFCEICTDESFRAMFPLLIQDGSIKKDIESLSTDNNNYNKGLLYESIRSCIVLHCRHELGLTLNHIEEMSDESKIQALRGSDAEYFETVDKADLERIPIQLGRLFGGTLEDEGTTDVKEKYVELIEKRVGFLNDFMISVKNAIDMGYEGPPLTPPPIARGFKVIGSEAIVDRADLTNSQEENLEGGSKNEAFLAVFRENFGSQDKIITHMLGFEE